MGWLHLPIPDRWLSKITMRIHALDFEGNRDCGIIEFGVATIERGQVVAAQTAICRARADIAASEVRLHGLSFRDTLEQPAFGDYWELFSGLRQSGLFCAHAAAVERGLLKSVWPYPSLSPNYPAATGAVADWGPWLDTHALYHYYYREGLDNYKLGTLIAAFHLGDKLEELAARHCPQKRRKPHCALYDALASALLLIRLMQETPLTQQGVAELLRVSAGAPPAQEELF